ncbi:uncharacterized protein LOC128212302 [Mya arenaria]|uniref:uncharacterized protein LOC128211326 n=1 Tax=Mya arenaria TaxID=6604 RepID=UPI0022E8871D|nr:uncharacterized protein LOC128211326 [Mya arenaria]XP_052771958.1 uncharacterized protein LOC128211326 [Mya arenaria]XP_052771959.1 uncharacterized protein LOC128211326 [Mya arenaria]XP_052771960.1 uncharacterized protein LOC128211326 [Mya arenaria]XP_052771961.1 uncharacterized protein LOC128211326 [Mya arenaria]XP_052773650.1 uncharacterized protein LOC128212302 [Mya arenaria]
MVAAFVILLGAALGMTTVVFQPTKDCPDVPDVDLIVPNNREVNETTSSMVASAHSHIKRGDDIGNEKQETERQEFTAEQKSLVCSGAACSTPDSARDSVFISSEEVDFSVEVQKLLKGEDIKFIDEND